MQVIQTKAIKLIQNNRIHLVATISQWNNNLNKIMTCQVKNINRQRVRIPIVKGVNHLKAKISVNRRKWYKIAREEVWLMRHYNFKIRKKNKLIRRKKKDNHNRKRNHKPTSNPYQRHSNQKTLLQLTNQPHRDSKRKQL